MSRPEWMERGRISEGGVPEKLGEGRFTTSRDRLRFHYKNSARKKRMEFIKNHLKRNQLSIWQKKAGARKVA